MELQNPTGSYAFWPIFPHVLLLFILLMHPTSIVTRPLGNETDRYALLKFKESILDDPHGVLTSSNDSVDFCSWPGVSCSKRHQRISSLDLDGHNLRGTISPYIGNLTFLRLIRLTSNSLFGEIPQEVGRLFRLQHLNLTDTMLEGKIPVNLSYCSQLRILSLHANKLTGRIPKELGSLQKLVYLRLGKNNLTGGIPPSLGNISSITWFSLVYNNLEGTVPKELGALKNLELFSLSSNNLSGIIPLSLYNMSSMRTLSISVNRFKGNLPPNIGQLLPSLQIFFGGSKEFSGRIPESFSNASQLQMLDIPNNSFVRQVPASLGNLPYLWSLVLSLNFLGNYSKNGVDFISSLTNCSQMSVLDLGCNNLGGILPNSVVNLSTKITYLNIGNNQIYGSIPIAIENLVNLITLIASQNLFTGVIPSSLGKLKNLQFLTLSKNMLSGEIPSSIGNLTQIFLLKLSRNKLKGKIPPNFAHLQNLQYLDISNNRLSGAIPKDLYSLPSLSLLLNLSKNSLTGNLPVEVGKLKNTNKLDLSENNLTGAIPETIGDCQSLVYLYLRGNFFQGVLPSSLASLLALEYLDLSHNNLIGQIPKDFVELRLLLNLNISFNNLEGEVPNRGVFQNISAISLVGNTKLCGGVPKLKLPRCPEKENQRGKASSLKIWIVTIVCIAAAFLLLAGFLILYWRKKSLRKSSTGPSKITFLSQVSYKMLYQATNGFSRSMLIGTGSFGSVYKGILDQDENPVAVKVFDLKQRKASKSFIAECNALRNIRHRNLVKFLTCCSSMDYSGNEFKALVFQYMSNGSLEEWLHLVTDSENQSRSLNFIQRLDIVVDVASALYYIHSHCDQPIVHCDLKPSNILLDSEMIAHVSDFGLARLISATTSFSESKTSTIGIKGTIGYAAPEYAMGSEPSIEGDVYSYGILILEIFTRKRPIDEMFKDDFNLHNFVKMALPERLLEVVDSSLLPRETEVTTVRREHGRNYINNIRGTEIEAEEGSIDFQNPNHISPRLLKCLASVLEIGVACSEESPNDRMSMEDVPNKLQRIKNEYMGIHGQRLRIS